MGITLKDLLPAIGGLAAGSLSPRLGQAGAQTLGAVDQIQQRKRSQTLEDERMQMSRDAAGRAERGEGRAQKTHMWNEENFLYQQRERDREANEMAHARQAGEQMIADYTTMGIDVPRGYREAAAGVQTPGQLKEVQSSIERWYSNTPLSPDQARALDSRYRAEGRVGYVYVRQPGGALVRSSIGSMGGDQQSGMPTGTLELINAIQTLRSKSLGEKHSKQTLETEGRKDMAKAREEKLFDDAPIDVTQAGAADKLLESETKDFGDSEMMNVETAELGSDSALQDVWGRINSKPMALQYIMQMMAGGMLPQDFLDPIAGGQAPSDAGGPSSTPGAAGIGHAARFIQ